MKIAIITDHIPSEYASSINIMKIAQGFHKLGHIVDVLAILRFKEEIRKLNTKSIYKFYAISKKIKIKYFRDKLPSYFRDLRLIGKSLDDVTNKISNNFPELITFFDPNKRISEYCKVKRYDFTICRRAEKVAYYNILKEIPTIIDSHGYTEKRAEDIGRILKYKHSKSFKGIMTLNSIIKQDYVNLGFPKEKIVFMENAVNLEKYDKITDDKLIIRKKLRIALNKKIILYTGGLYNDRGLDIVLKSSKLLDNKIFSFYFIGGNIKEIKSWQDFIVDNNINSEIHFLGWKDKVLIPYYLKAADILLATYSPNCPTLRFMSPVKLIEYWASKTPCIATNIGRNIDLCAHDECLLTDPEDPKDLAEKIELLVNNENLKIKIINNAYTKAKDHTLEKRCEKFLELIK